MIMEDVLAMLTDIRAQMAQHTDLLVRIAANAEKLATPTPLAIVDRALRKHLEETLGPISPSAWAAAEQVTWTCGHVHATRGEAMRCQAEQAGREQRELNARPRDADEPAR